jgi:Spy/CpxP family protein refolding chaperone
VDNVDNMDNIGRRPRGATALTLITSLLVSMVFVGCGAEHQESQGDEPAGESNAPGGAPTKATPSGKKGPAISYSVGAQEGRWHANRTHQFDTDLTDEQRSQIAQLEAIGYAEGVHEGTFPSGVTRHDANRAHNGLNLLTSAHEPGALLLDMSGEVLHRWSMPFSDVWPDYPGKRQNTAFWRRAHLYENGDVLAIYEGLGIIRVDKDSNLLWSSAVRAHHDMAPMPDGSVWVLSREARLIPRVHEQRPVMEDFISLLDAEGHEVRRLSILKALENSPFSHHWSGKLGRIGDIFHTNSIQRLDGSFADVHPAFAEGNFLISMLMLDLIAVVDPEQETVVWALTGAFNRQHDPSVLANGKLLLFDNNPRDQSSRILELDPATGEQAWLYTGSEDEPFFSATCGAAQRLANGNTVVTESDYGRAFEVTAEGNIVWEYYNQFRAGQDGRYIATMMEMRRLPPSFPVDWAANSAAAETGR